MRTVLTLCLWFAATAVWGGDLASERLNNWHQWRGPEANGVAPHGNPPVRWDEKTNLQWKIEIPGRGSSTPIIFDTPYVPSPLLYGDTLYFTKSNSAILTSLNATTGKPIYEAKRLPDIDNLYASPVGAADRVYFVSRDGTTVVLKHGPKLEFLATNKLDDAIDASPAIVGKQLFLRGRKYLYCFADR